MGLEAGNLLWLTCLSYGINGLTDADLGLDRLHFLVDGKEHTRIDAES